jgi:hypothetical protein
MPIQHALLQSSVISQSAGPIVQRSGLPSVDIVLKSSLTDNSPPPRGSQLRRRRFDLVGAGRTFYRQPELDLLWICASATRLSLRHFARCDRPSGPIEPRCTIVPRVHVGLQYGRRHADVVLHIAVLFSGRHCVGVRAAKESCKTVCGRSVCTSQRTASAVSRRVLGWVVRDLVGSFRAMPRSKLEIMRKRAAARSLVQRTCPRAVRKRDLYRT